MIGLADVTFYEANPGLLDDEDTFWAIEAGIERKWFPLGKTTIYGQYYDYDGGSLSRYHQLSSDGRGCQRPSAAQSHRYVPSRCPTASALCRASMLQQCRCT